MTQARSCKKCGYLNLKATHTELEVCPECGAIYSRVEAAIRDGKPVITIQPPRPVPVIPPPAQLQPPTQVQKPAPEPVTIDRQYIEVLREQSNYPNFRAFVRFCTGLGYVIAAICAIGGIITGTGVGAVSGIFAAVLIVIISKFGKESFSMLADLSDAATVIAENSKKN